MPTKPRLFLVAIALSISASTLSAHAFDPSLFEDEEMSGLRRQMAPLLDMAPLPKPILEEGQNSLGSTNIDSQNPLSEKQLEAFADRLHFTTFSEETEPPFIKSLEKEAMMEDESKGLAASAIYSVPSDAGLTEDIQAKEFAHLIGFSPDNQILLIAFQKESVMERIEKVLEKVGFNTLLGGESLE